MSYSKPPRSKPENGKAQSENPYCHPFRRSTVRYPILNRWAGQLNPTPNYYHEAWMSKHGEGGQASYELWIGYRLVYSPRDFLCLFREQYNFAQNNSTFQANWLAFQLLEACALKLAKAKHPYQVEACDGVVHEDWAGFVKQVYGRLTSS